MNTVKKTWARSAVLWWMIPFGVMVLFNVFSWILTGKEYDPWFLYNKMVGK